MGMEQTIMNLTMKVMKVPQTRNIHQQIYAS